MTNLALEKEPSHRATKLLLTERAVEQECSPLHSDRQNDFGNSFTASILHHPFEAYQLSSVTSVKIGDRSIQCCSSNVSSKPTEKVSNFRQNTVFLFSSY